MEILLTWVGVASALIAAVFSAKSANAAQRQAKAAEVSNTQAAAHAQIARAALGEAKRQNRIAAHGHRLQVVALL